MDTHRARYEPLPLTRHETGRCPRLAQARSFPAGPPPPPSAASPSSSTLPPRPSSFNPTSTYTLLTAPGACEEALQAHVEDGNPYNEKITWPKVKAIFHVPSNWLIILQVSGSIPSSRLRISALAAWALTRPRAPSLATTALPLLLCSTPGSFYPDSRPLSPGFTRLPALGNDDDLLQRLSADKERVLAGGEISPLTGPEGRRARSPDGKRRERERER